MKNGEWELTKTKIIVSRNGGKTSKTETLFYKNKKVEVVAYYGYLGLIFSSRNLWTKTLSTLAAQAEKALSSIRRMVWELNHPNINVLFKIFDSRVAPILFLWSRNLGELAWKSNRKSSLAI